MNVEVKRCRTAPESWIYKTKVTFWWQNKFRIEFWSQCHILSFYVKKRLKNEGPDQAINLQTPPRGTPGGTPQISGNKLSYIPVSKRGIPPVGEFIYTNYLNTDNIYM